MVQQPVAHEDMTNKPYIGIIGCGKVGRTLVARLLDSWHILVVDKNENVAKSLESLYEPEQVTCFSGDATSYFFLRSTKIKHAYQILIGIENDEIVNEVIHILQDRMMIRNIISQTTNITFAENLKKKGVTVAYAPNVIVNFMINQMSIGQNIATYVGKGEGEIMQIQLTKNSPLIGLPLSKIPLRKWIVGGIYRPKRNKNINSLSYIGRLQVSKDDKLIIPRGSTIPQVGDKLLLIGEPNILKSTIQYLQAGTPSFPKRYGEAVISLFLNNEIDISAHRQYMWLTKNIESSEIYYFYNSKMGEKMSRRNHSLIHNSGAEKQLKKSHHIRLNKISQLISDIAQKKRIGLIIYRTPKNIIINWIHRSFLMPNLIKSVRDYDTPLWIIKRNRSIRSITFFVSTNEDSLRAAELAIDAAIRLKLNIKAIQVNPPPIITGKKQLDKSEEIMQSIREVAALHGVTMQEIIREGNPVKETLRSVTPDELLVLSLPKKGDERFLIPNSQSLLCKKFLGSLLVLAT